MTAVFNPTACVVNHRIFSETLKFYSELIADIENAKNNICFEIFKFIDDAVGIRIRDALIKKSREGVRVRLMIDSWGVPSSDTFFDELVSAGGQVRFFMKLRYNLDALTKHHRRNHRKIIVIDDHIVYLGSANINQYSITWRELIVKMEGKIAHTFKKAFNSSWKIYRKNTFNIRHQTTALSCGDFKIIRDVPSLTRQKVKKKFESLIKNARRQVIIETPYFLPGYYLRKLLMDAGKRGVDVKVIIPKQSDVTLVDILRNKYLGLLHKNNVQLLMYKPNNLHSKMMLVDNEEFFFGTSNFDYRSFRYMYEIMLLGKDPNLLQDLVVHNNKTLENCDTFNYELWKKRPMMQKFFENLLIPFRHLL